MCTSIIFQSKDRLYLANTEGIFLPTGMLFTKAPCKRSWGSTFRKN